MENDVLLIRKMVSSPLLFIEYMWKLKPQPLNCSKDHVHEVFCYGQFIKGKHITWQQTQILEGIEKSISGALPKRISVSSGHGIGKDALLSWIIHWFLFTRKNSQIGCTAPTSSQMYDILWKELSVWQRRLPKEIMEIFEWSTTHYKINEAPQIWWARARTAAKETPEAFAGLHGDSVMLIADEASGVPDEIYRVGEGSLTNKDTLVILMGNPTRTEGFFYKTFTDKTEKINWQCFEFSSAESPIVEQNFVRRIETKYGKDSDEFRYMVLGKSPKIAGMLDGGWIPLLSEGELRFTQDIGTWKLAKLGVDPAGEGSNKSVFVVRDNFKAKIAGRESKSTPLTVANIASTLANHYEIKENEVTVDNFGEGANVAQEYALATGQRVQAVNVGEKPDDQERYINKRSEAYWRLREWIIRGGQLVGTLEDWKSLLTIYYRRNLRGKITIMPKVDMFKHGWDSPDCFVAGTEIKTPEGVKKIEDFKVGDKVLTPFGERNVIKVWEVETDKLTKVKFTNGSILVGKGKHKILTKKGFCSLDALTMTDIIEVWNTRSRFIWKIKKSLFGGERSIGLRKMADIFTKTSITEKMEEERNRFIMPYGNFIRVKQFLLDMLFIIKTRILSIIPIKIWNLNPQANIFPNILFKTSETLNLENKIKNYYLSSDHWRINGMEARRDWHGIKNMESEHGLAENQNQKYVFNVKKNSPPILKQQNFVLLNAVLKTLGMISVIIRIKDFVWNVKKNLWQIGIGIQNVAVKNAQSITVLKTKVYNLTLDKDNVYYANDILVENCADALSLTFARPEGVQKDERRKNRAIIEPTNSELEKIAAIYR